MVAQMFDERIGGDWVIDATKPGTKARHLIAGNVLAWVS
jgi:hypothetical protein